MCKLGGGLDGEQGVHKKGINTVSVYRCICLGPARMYRQEWITNWHSMAFLSGEFSGWRAWHGISTAWHGTTHGRGGV